MQPECVMRSRNCDSGLCEAEGKEEAKEALIRPALVAKLCALKSR